MSHLHLSTLLLGCSLLLLSGCGLARTDPSDEPTPIFEPVATFTPTPVPSTTESSALSPPTIAVVLEVMPALTSTESLTTIPAVESDLAATELLPTLTPEPLPTLATQATSARLTVIVDAANVRNGPGTDYLQIAVATSDTQFPVVGRNEPGDWWQVCCFNDQPGWLFGTLVEVQNPELVAVVIAPPIIPPTTEAVAQIAPESEPTSAEPALPEAEAAPVAVSPGEESGTAGSFDPNAQYHIVHYRVLGFADNNGGIFNKGGQHHIFITVLDQNGNGIDGVVVKDAVGDKLNIVTGSKGPGKAEIEMYWDRYKLYVAADPSGAVTSQISNQMNTAYPHIPDVVGLLGPVDNEYAICPTADDRCTPPFYHAHWSYEITFQKVQ